LLRLFSAVIPKSYIHHFVESSRIKKLVPKTSQPKYRSIKSTSGIEAKGTTKLRYVVPFGHTFVKAPICNHPIYIPVWPHHSTFQKTANYFWHQENVQMYVYIHMYVCMYICTYVVSLIFATLAYICATDFYEPTLFFYPAYIKIHVCVRDFLIDVYI
jgi:hypothetical protein